MEGAGTGGVSGAMMQEDTAGPEEDNYDDEVGERRNDNGTGEQAEADDHIDGEGGD